MVQSIVEAVAMHAIKQPGKKCLIDNKNVLSYKDYWNLVYGIAEHLKHRGLQKSDCVVVKSMQSIDFAACGLAIQLAGGIFVPVEKNVSNDRINEIVNMTSAKYIMAAGNIFGSCEEIDITNIRRFMQKESVDVGKVSFPCKEDTAEILYTTGTTGRSKGIELSHNSMVAVAENILYGVEMKADNVELIPVPINHSYGLRSYYASMLNGSTAVIADGVVFIEHFFKMLDQYSVTSLALVPAAIEIILKLSKERLGNYKDQIDYIQSGSAVLSEVTKNQLCRLLPNSRLYNFYGSTEAGRCCIIDYNKEKEKTACIGRPAYNASFCIIDNDGRIIKSSKQNTGILACAGAMNMKGYWKENELTSETIVNGYVQTSDIAYIGTDGCIYLVGRKGDVINAGGNKVSPMEVEEYAKKYPGISECVCIPMKDNLLGQVPKLMVVMKEDFSFSKQDIYNFLSQYLEGYKLPKSIEQISEVPRTYNGKIIRNKLV